MAQIDELLQQLTTIQVTQTTHTTMLKNLHAGTIDIKAALQHLIKQVADLHRKLDNLAPPSPITPLSATVASSTASTPPLPKLATPQPTPVIVPVAVAPSPPPPLPPAKSSSPPQYPIFVPMQNSVHYQSDAYYSGAALYKALGATQALNSTWHIEQKWIGAHNLFVEMNKLKLEWADASSVFAEMSKWKCESKPLIFDPGGKIKFERVFAPTYDLEDKVNFKASVMIQQWIEEIGT